MDEHMLEMLTYFLLLSGIWTIAVAFYATGGNDD